MPLLEAVVAIMRQSYNNNNNNWFYSNMLYDYICINHINVAIGYQQDLLGT